MRILGLKLQEITNIITVTTGAATKAAPNVLTL
jgi:hypothetical protein